MFFNIPRSSFFVAALLLGLAPQALSSVNLMVVGDWGGMPIPPYILPGQMRAAAGMGVVAEQIRADAVLALGDNFYFNGVRDSSSQRFEEGWNALYSAPSLQVPWLLIGGNHDHYGNITAQVEYTQIDPSGRWTFPDLYHTHSFSSAADGVTVDVVMIDTVDLAGASGVADESDPRYYDALPPRPRAAAATQWDWIEQQLNASTAQYLIVAGHYPVYSVCEHGPTQNLVDNLEPLLVRYGAHYLAGHDHCHVALNNNGVQYMVTGVGDTCCTDDSHLDSVPEGSLEWYMGGARRPNQPEEAIGGFASLEIGPKAMRASYYDQDAVLLYTAPDMPPRVGKA